MIINTTAGTKLDSELIHNYFSNLVNQFFKILPMRETNEKSLPIYICSLRDELLGCNKLIEDLEYDPSFLTLINILQYFIDNQDCSVKETKREVFKAISICNTFKARYKKGGAEDERMG